MSSLPSTEMPFASMRAAARRWFATALFQTRPRGQYRRGGISYATLRARFAAAAGRSALGAAVFDELMREYTRGRQTACVNAFHCEVCAFVGADSLGQVRGGADKLGGVCGWAFVDASPVEGEANDANDEEDEEMCAACGESTVSSACASNSVVICDQCDCEVHLECAGLSRVPRGAFFCAACAGETHACEDQIMPLSAVGAPSDDAPPLAARAIVPLGALSPGALSPGALSPGVLSPGALSPGVLSSGALLSISPGALSPVGEEDEKTCSVSGESTAVSACAKNSLVICDQCDREVHKECTGLSRVPRGAFFCAACAGEARTREDQIMPLSATGAPSDDALPLAARAIVPLGALSPGALSPDVLLPGGLSSSALAPVAAQVVLTPRPIDLEVWLRERGFRDAYVADVLGAADEIDELAGALPDELEELTVGWKILSRKRFLRECEILRSSSSSSDDDRRAALPPPPPRIAVALDDVSLGVSHAQAGHTATPIANRGRPREDPANTGPDDDEAPPRKRGN